MKNITSEQIDKIINDILLTIDESMPSNFAENYENFEKVLNEVNAFSNDVERANASIYFTILKTVQDNCIEILSRTLKHLLCDE